MSPAEVRLGRTGLKRLEAGHPWAYRSHLEKDPGPALDAGPVRLLDDRGRPFGSGLYSPRSQIAVRLLTREERAIDATFLTDRLVRARDYRRALLGTRDACRQVFAESDGLPSLIVDQYGPHLVVQSLSAGMEALRPLLVEALEGVFSPQSILARNDPAVRGLEGLPREVVPWAGEPPERIVVREGEIDVEVDPWRGQKTGAFLDQADNHAAAALLARGRVLDVFTCNGGFGLPAARRASEVVLVDSSREALAAASRNADRNRIANVSLVEANAFDFLKSADQSGEKFDMVILDPPAFAKNKAELEGGIRGYKEINLRAMKLLNPGGRLITCSCSYHLTEPLFLDVLAAAAADVKRRFRIIEKRTQGRDHPLLVGFPESYYLKCFFLEMLD